MNTLKLIYYTSPEGIYIAEDEYGWNGRPDLKFSKVNGKPTQKTFSKGWCFIAGEKEVNKIERFIPAKNVHIGFQLKDGSLASEKIPSYLSLEESAYNWGYDGDPWEDSPYKDYSSLYEKVLEEIPETYEELEFEAENKGNLDIKYREKPADMRLTVYKTEWTHQGTKEIDLSGVARWSELEKILTPEFALPERPCSLTSKQTYDIVRYYVKENIVPKIAEVTSDHDFCFTVKKKISIKPYIHRWEEKKANGKSYARPRMRNRTITHTSEKIFEMGHKDKPWQDYTPIEGFAGESLEDLVENVKLFLDELMFHINSPVEQCEKCNGTGHILPEIKRGNK
jgi:hypothetical protein